MAQDFAGAEPPRGARADVAPPDARRTVEIERVARGARADAVDCAAVEEPLDVRLHGEPFAVIMRTPGHDAELVAGFLAAEQVIASAADLADIAVHDGTSAAGANVIADVALAPHRRGALPDLLAGRRAVAQNSSCGMCGRRTIESLGLAAPPHLAADWTIPPRVIVLLPDRLRAAQRVFDETGGLHAAGLFDPDGALVLCREDVGRHNAVDKVIGRRLLDNGLPLGSHVLFVSGRTSFEIVQKAILAGIPLVAAVSAPSTFAIDLARDAGLTLVGFVRGSSFNVYAHGFRIRDVDPV